MNAGLMLQSSRILCLGWFKDSFILAWGCSIFMCTVSQPCIVLSIVVGHLGFRFFMVWGLGCRAWGLGSDV